MEWLWFIAGFLVGGVLVYWLCTRAQQDEAEAAAMESSSRIADLPEASAAPAPAPAPEPEPDPEPVDPDDLTKVEGIGPKIAEMMNDNGIATFAQLAAAPVERLQEILDGGGPRYQVHNPASWPMQAGLAAEGKWDELEELQDRLDGGKIE